MAQLNLKIDPYELIKIIVLIGTLLGFGIPSVMKIWKTYEEIHYMYDAFKKAAEIQEKK